jgi:hypothetical protein
VPVIARVEDDRLIIDLRTVFPEQEPLLIAALSASLRLRNLRGSRSSCDLLPSGT